MFNPVTYQTRRNELRSRLAREGITEGTILVPGNRESPANYADNCYRFRQDSTFLYLFGHAIPGLAGTIELANGKTCLFGEAHSLDDEIWTGPLPSLEELGKLSGADRAKPYAEIKTELRPYAAPPRATRAGESRDTAARVHFVSPYRAEQRLELLSLLGEEGFSATLAADGHQDRLAAQASEGRQTPTSTIAPSSARLFAAVDAAASLPLMRALVALREIKNVEEIAELDRAADQSAAMHRAVLKAAQPGMREYELAAIAAGLALADGGGLAFPIIATTRGAVLHNHEYGNRLEAGGLALIDMGAETVRGYAGDLTTTFPIGPSYDSRQRAIYEIVLSGFKAATELLKPGLAFKEAHFAAARAMSQGLKELGLMRGDPAEAVAAGAHALFFPHGLGHQIGLDVHDMENYGEVLVGYDGQPKSTEFGLKSLRLAKPLKAGMTHSVEPGLYFIAPLIQRWKAERRHEAFLDYAAIEDWIGFGGVRNEEDWLITETSARKLGKPFDKSIEAIEAYRRGN